MSSENIDSNITSAKLIRRLQSVKTDAVNEKNRLVLLARQFRCLDKIGKSIGLVSDAAFTKRISWQGHVDRLEEKTETENSIDIAQRELSSSISQLQHQIIPALHAWQNKWLTRVILVETIILLLIAFALTGIIYYQGAADIPHLKTMLLSELYNRPIFLITSGSLLFFGLVAIHFRIRRWAAMKIASIINTESSEFNLSNAFLKNTRIRHSIFKPGIAGFGWLNRKRLKKIKPAPTEDFFIDSDING
ncbi:MAG: hypothetical protein GXP13_02785 [Gammaproteobacteria bacterium]|nr:hypothetical protein [Gammaproteobacteria bacterium]